jgi:hypothetical protein
MSERADHANCDQDNCRDNKIAPIMRCHVPRYSNAGQDGTIDRSSQLLPPSITRNCRRRSGTVWGRLRRFGSKRRVQQVADSSNPISATQRHCCRAAQRFMQASEIVERDETAAKFGGISETLKEAVN